MKNIFRTLTTFFGGKTKEEMEIVVEYQKTTMKRAMNVPPITDVSQVILSEKDLKKAAAQ